MFAAKLQVSINVYFLPNISTFLAHYFIKLDGLYAKSPSPGREKDFHQLFSSNSIQK
jgi:hypothetical protein